MNFHEFGNKNNPHIMLIHGGGNAWWNYLRQARVLSEYYHVILPTLDGHGEEYKTAYISTEDTADKLMKYIDEECGGHLFSLCGVSLGGQIVIEILSRKPDITEKAIIDGSICYPRPNMARACMMSIRFFRGLLFSEKACRFQIAMMSKLFPKNMQYPDEIKNYYMKDMPHVRKETLYAMYRTYMMKYTLKESLRETTAQVMYWYGEKEMKCVKNSAKMFQSYVPSCKIYEAKGYNHGYLAIYLPNEWLEITEPFFQQNEMI
ncbi:alpha/beta hydrolase [Clostridioides sp. ES-S-0005-03]|uniref:alpha/beta fold hydrolase n=1 Tax=unclassified Clostridioides TaxID=2635829 RepID=UPI001D0C147D|nr:alpha/beta hydrolase [Clostridioides sp. ES-S-0145-01]MCC0680201.1 alpha/beta hydrolase [Clostridioides sp. ES-S-0005-03]MCC0695346.1 alpha/beta hydrolase [Clostridioides sp. ES-S-0048-02]MCC0701752.1 alpha/beta hydrolase [Clostridioides sp. ES-S-0049-02]MCC0761605.1 alpha/beta hydrolase [Clostridioides sp. ES-S-0006-03]UDN46432.1 alpha/beta hydrolase [Clostridioides sp. ES-S-0173-01]